MPQMNPGGKYVFGTSQIGRDGRVGFPDQAVEEYRLTDERFVYLFTGSKSTGGFCVTRRGLLLPSKLGHILTENPSLLYRTAPPGEFIPYKGRAYCWLNISPPGIIFLTEPMMAFLEIAPGMALLSIRSSDIAFTMGAKGPLLEKKERFAGEIPAF